MNKVFQINLGGTPFTIDDDAYEQLHAYLEALHQHFRGTEGYTEITSDIEARLAELFTESLGNRKIVTASEVDAAIEVMGRPEEFGADPLSGTADSTKTSTGSGSTYRTGKRLFRDPENKVVGGVCSGIAAHFGIPDPIWVRLLFALIIISGGLGLPLYIILWAIMPEAKTAGDRLAMRGEPINVDNITRIVREEFDNLSEKVTELSEEWTGKKKAGKTAGSAKRNKPPVMDEDVDETEQYFSAAHATEHHTSYHHSRSDWPDRRPLFQSVFRLILIVIMILLVLWLSAICFSIIVGAFVSFPYIGYIFPGQENLSILAMANVLFVIALPIAAVVMALSRVVFHTRIRAGWNWGLAGFWLLNLIGLGAIGSQLGTQFIAHADHQQEIDIQPFLTDTLRLNTYRMSEERNISFFDGNVDLGDDFIRTDDVRIVVKRSKDDQWRLVKQTYSRGASYLDASTKAENIIAPIKLEQGLLSFPTAYELRNRPAYRGQSVQFELMVPEGELLLFEPDFFNIHNNIILLNRKERPYRKEGNIWRMEAEGLSCISCDTQTEQQEDQRLGYSDFSDVSISGKMKVNLDYSDDHYLRITGPQHVVDAIVIEQNEERISISGPEVEDGSPVRIYMNLPALKKLQLSETDDVRLRGFDQEKLSIHAVGDFEIKSYSDVHQMEVALSNRCELELRGKINELTATLSSQARLDGDHADITAARVEKTEDVKVGLPAYTKKLRF